MAKKMRKSRPYHHGNLRAELVSTGLTLLREGGPEALTTRACAKAVGVAPSAFFRHFIDRRALATAIATAGFKLFGEHIKMKVASSQPNSELLAMGTAYIEFALQEPQLFRLMFRGEAIDMTDADYRAAANPLLENMASSIGGGIGNSLHAILAWALVHGLATLSLDSQLDEQLPSLPEARLEVLGQILQKGAQNVLNFK